MKNLLILTISLLFGIKIYPQAKLVESNNDFAFRFYKVGKPDSLNYFISPFSLYLALSIVNEGAKNLTRKEMDSLLSIRNMDNRAIQYNDLIQKTIDLSEPDFRNRKSSGKKGQNEIILANSLWINDAVPVDSRFVENIRDNFKSEIHEYDKSDINSANSQLNSWITKNTNGKIREIAGLNKDARLSIFNAIYFKGEWDKPFDIKKTRKRKFHSLDHTKIDVNYMRDQSFYKYYEDSDLQSVYLPYKYAQFSMIVILPQKRFGILDIENKLNRNYFSKIDSLSNSVEVILSFPKYRIESEILPEEEIIKMGFPEMFSDKADFSGISAVKPLNIGSITHKTFIETDERKTEAAAMSSITVVGYGAGADPLPPPPPKVFDADHPFIFLIIDNRTKAILFTGRFVRAT